MKVTFLGTGTSQGVPVIACDCLICKSTNRKDKRLRTSVMLEEGATTIVIDSGPDFRQQMLRENVQKLDAIIFTHSHKDHTAGLDDIRGFNYKHQREMDIYADEQVQDALKKEFAYIFHEIKYPGIPKIKFFTIGKSSFKIRQLNIVPIEVFHHKLSVLGFRINDFTYITDANFIPENEKKKIYGSSVVVLNALRKEKHISHFTLDEAVAEFHGLKSDKCYLTHISHQLGLHDEVNEDLSENIRLAYDGLKINI